MLNATKEKLSAGRNVLLWLLIVGVSCQVPGVLILKHHDWHEDDLGFDLRSPAWLARRQYSSEVEGGLAILSQVEPSQVAYLRSRGNPIEFLPCAGGRRGYTSVPQGIVHVCNQFRSEPAELAVVLSHEIVHLERHDPDSRPAKHSRLHRWLGFTEEQDAHWQGLKTALKLLPHHPSVWHVLGWQWFLEIYWRLWPIWLALLELPLVIALGVHFDKSRTRKR